MHKMYDRAAGRVSAGWMFFRLAGCVVLVCGAGLVLLLAVVPGDAGASARLSVSALMGNERERIISLAYDATPAESRQVRIELAALLADSPDTFLKLADTDILLLFNRPDQQRQDSHASVWQYRTENCVVDLYLSPAEDMGDSGPDSEKAPLKVMHYEARDRLTVDVSAGKRGWPAGQAAGSRSAGVSCIRELIRKNIPQNAVRKYAGAHAVFSTKAQRS